MYNPNPFKIEDLSSIEKFIKENSLATLISSTPNNISGSHLPLLIEKRNKTYYLIGHMARDNKQVDELRVNENVLVIFSGTNSYISAYAKDPKKLSILPTWNYQKIHAKGILKFVDENRLKKSLSNLIKLHEGNQPKSMNLSDYPENIFRKKIRAIIGFEIEVKKVEGCFRLNQNRTDEEKDNIKNALKDNSQMVKAIDEFNKK